MPETEHDQPLSYTGSVQLRDGLIHLIVDSSLQKYYGSYHSQTATVIYGTEITVANQTTLHIGERTIDLDSLDRAEMISLICEQSDAWLTIRTNDEIHEMLAALSAVPTILNSGVIFPPALPTVQPAARDNVIQTPPSAPVVGSIFSFTEPPSTPEVAPVATPSTPSSPVDASPTSIITAAGPVFGRPGAAPQPSVHPDRLPLPEAELTLQQASLQASAAAPRPAPLPARAPTPAIGRGGFPKTPSSDVSLGTFELPETQMTQAQLDSTESSPPTTLPEQSEILSWDHPDSTPAFPSTAAQPASPSDTRRKMMPAEAAQAAKMIKQQLQQAQPKEPARAGAPSDGRSDGLFAQIRRRFTGR